MKDIIVIGITGPMGAGKDTVAKILQKQGAEIIDVDKLAHTLYPAQSPLWQKIVKAFGSKILSRGGEINRKKLGAMVFGERRKLKLLNQIVHPELKKEVQRCLLSAVSRKLIVINAALLKEIGLVELVDEVWVVRASQAVRLKRLMKKGMDKKSALKRMKMQMGQKEYLKMADKVINNNGKIRNRIKI
ncbi:MAG: dephospho-CoA kinase [Candidatus Margulisiibacteriota bacterium]